MVTSDAQPPPLQVPSAPPRSPTQSVHSLPRIELPKYDGSSLGWRPFLAQFDAAIDRQPLPLVQKLIYPKNCLQGEAKNALASLMLTAENYTVARDLLKNRFCDPANLIAMYGNEIVSLPADGDDDAPGLRRFLDRFTVAHRELKSLLAEVQGESSEAVSYTHLTLPTICSV